MIFQIVYHIYPYNVFWWYYNQGHSTWVTLLWYLSFSLPTLFCNGFSVKLYKFEANIERDKEKEVEHNISTLFLQLTQVLMSRIVVLHSRIHELDNA